MAKEAGNMKLESILNVSSVPTGIDHLSRLSRFRIPFLIFLLITVFQGCVAVNTFPIIARPSDTVSVMVGGSETARKDNVDVTLTDTSGSWDLQAMGLVRSVFNLRADGRAHGMHYSGDYFDVENAWKKAHEPTQTVLIVDIPDAAAAGPAALSVNINATDDSSGIIGPFTINLEILADPGTPTFFDRQNFDNTTVAVDFESLEPAPHAKVSFGRGGLGGGLGSKIFAAASLVIDFNQAVVNGDDLNIYSPQPTIRGTPTTYPNAAFGDRQHMLYWRQDGSQLYIDIIAPEEIAGRYLQLYIMHPRSVVGDPAFSLSNVTLYDINGNDITTTIGGSPTLTYYP